MISTRAPWKKQAASLITALALLTGGGAALADDQGGGQDPDIGERAEYSWQQIKEFSAEKSEAARETGSALLDDMDEAISALEQKRKSASESAGETADDAWSATRERLQALKEATGEKVDALGDASADAWDGAKQGVRDASNSFVEAYEEAKREFSED